MDVSARHFVITKYAVILFDLRYKTDRNPVKVPLEFLFSIPDDLCRLDGNPSSHGLSSVYQDQCVLMEEAG